MKVTKKSEYAIRAILYLSSKKPNTKIVAKEISTNMDIPKQFLAQVMLSLNQNGYVRAVRGAKGGFVLAKRPSKISLLEIVEAIEGKVFLNECLVSQDICECKPICPVAEVWDNAQRSLVAVLKKATFSSLTRKSREKEKLINKLKGSDVCCKSLYVEQ